MSLIMFMNTSNLSVEYVDSNYYTIKFWFSFRTVNFCFREEHLLNQKWKFKEILNYYVDSHSNGIYNHKLALFETTMQT